MLETRPRTAPPATVDYEISLAASVYVNEKLRGYRRDVYQARRVLKKQMVGVPILIQKAVIKAFIARFNRTTSRDNVGAAMAYLVNKMTPIRQILQQSALVEMGALYDADKQKQAAAAASALCENIVNTLPKTGDYGRNLFAAYERIARYAKSLDIDLPMNDYNALTDYESAIVRAMCPLWWRKRIKRAAAQIVERCFLVAKMINKYTNKYVSKFTLNRFICQQKENDEFLDNFVAYDDETGEHITLKQAVDVSSACPRIRRLELMLRVHGLENIAKEKDYKAVFVTLTAPSKYHACSTKYGGYTPVQTHKYLCQQWAKIRAKAAREKIHWHGVRVVEPHQDATPHWHLLIFVDNARALDMQMIMRRYALEVDGCEKGARKQRITFQTIDPSKGSAAGYIAKYIAKNIDAAGIEKDVDFEDKKSPLEQSALSVVAWSRLWNIRQFQFFGCESITVYRELRRIRRVLDYAPAEALRLSVEPNDDGERCLWFEYTKAMQAIDAAPAYKDMLNRFDEPSKKITGVNVSGVAIDTRNDNITIMSKRNAQLKKGARALHGRPAAAWIADINCTPCDNRLNARQVSNQEVINIQGQIRAMYAGVGGDMLAAITQNVIRGLSERKQSNVA